MISNKLLAGKSTEAETLKLVSLISKKGFNNFFTITALSILAFTISWAAYNFIFKKPHTESLTYNQIITTKGQKSQIILSDGTKVWLNAETILKYPHVFNEIQFEIFLEGEAFFEVHRRDNNIPILVKTSDIDIEVLGASFNVMAYSDEEAIEITAVKGSVSLVGKGLRSLSDLNVILKPNEKATLIKKGSRVIYSEVEIEKPTIVKSTKKGESDSPAGIEQIIISSNVNIELHTAWRDDVLVFQSETFENIAHKLEKWYDVKIHIQNEELKDYRYTGKFTHKETLSQVLEILNFITPINYAFKRNDLYVDKATSS